MITPNKFEAELLSGISLHSEADCVECLKKLHSFGPPVVVITSVELEQEPGKICCFVLDASSSHLIISKILVRKLPGVFY